MHSKVDVADFFSRPIPSFTGLCSLSIFDPFVWTLIAAKLGSGWKSSFASELSISELEKELLNYSLFATENNFVIHDADSLNKQVYTWIAENGEKFAGKNYLFVFRKNTPWRKKWFEQGTHLSVEAPKFWEDGKTLDLLCRLLSVKLRPDARRVFLERVPFGWGEYYEMLLSLTNGEAREISAEDLLAELKKTKLDKFKLAGLMANKRTQLFWREVLDLDIDDNELKDLFLFIQSHLFKMLNHGELAAKKTLNKYEKEILASARNWQADDLHSELKKFNDYEFRLKAKDPFLKAYLRTFTY